jgi:hypothetical protein
MCASLLGCDENVLAFRNLLRDGLWQRVGQTESYEVETSVLFSVGQVAAVTNVDFAEAWLDCALNNCGRRRVGRRVWPGHVWDFYAR